MIFPRKKKYSAHLNSTQMLTISPFAALELKTEHGSAIVLKMVKRSLQSTDTRLPLASRRPHPHKLTGLIPVVCDV